MCAASPAFWASVTASSPTASSTTPAPWSCSTPTAASWPAPRRWAASPTPSSSQRSGKLCKTAHVRAKELGHVDAAAGMLVVLHHRDQGTAHGEDGTVERGQQLRLDAV